MMASPMTSASTLGRRSGSDGWRGRALAVLLASTALSPTGLRADVLPTGATVLHGSVTIATPAPGQMHISQTTPQAILTWGDFSIGQGAGVTISQPGVAATLLNRVTGDTTSHIDGSLTANGQVFVVNPNGIAIGPDGRITAGGFVASTLPFSDDDFLAGRLRFESQGTPGAVSNAGRIDILPGGYAALLGGQVANSGVIRAPLGRVGLGAARRITLDLAGDGFLQIGVPLDDDGGAPLIEHSGRIEADGGRVEILGAAARHAARQTVNLSGVVEATSVGGRSGAIVLGAGPGGTMRVAGRVAARAPVPEPPTASPVPPSRPARGGSIDVTGAGIVLDGADIDAGGAAGGGTIRIGGDLRGTGAMPRARTVTGDAATRIAADALADGDGGSIILWSEAATRFAGSLSVRGGAGGGDGGLAEVSSADRLSYSGRTDARAPRGRTGTLLLDPLNLAIVADAGATPPGFSAVLRDALEADLDTANVTLTTSLPGPDAGDIRVLADIAWSSANVLSLSADADIAIDGSITAPAGGLRLSAAGQITTGPGGAIDLGRFELDQGAWVQTGADLPPFAAGDFVVAGTDPLLSGASSFLRALGGAGTPDDPYLLTDIYGVQGVATRVTESFALANDIDASGTADWNDGAGFRPIARDVGGRLTGYNGFEGVFDGRGRAIGGLTIAAGAAVDSGFIGLLDGTLRNLRLTDADVSGGTDVSGIAVGRNGGLIEAVGVSGSVDGLGAVGGLAGVNDGTIRMSRADARVGADASAIGGSSVAIGGLVGVNGGVLADVAATGDVRGIADLSVEAGGLVGRSGGTIERAYATGAVRGATPFGSALLGGLVGNGLGRIVEGLAVGPVLDDLGVCISCNVSTGGLVGRFDGPLDGIVASFWDVDTTGQASSDGGGTGLETGTLQSFPDFRALAEAAGWNFFTNWAPASAGYYAQLYRIDPVAWLDARDSASTYGDPVTFDFDRYGTPFGYVFGPEFLSPGDWEAVATFALPPMAVGDYAVAGSVLSRRIADLTEFAYRTVVTPAVHSILPAPLTVTAGDLAKVYGTAVDPGLAGFAVAGLVGADRVDAVTLTSAGAAAEAGVAGSPYAILAADATGAGLENYTIAYVPGSLTVTPIEVPSAATGAPVPPVALPSPPDSIVLTGAVQPAAGQPAAVLSPAAPPGAALPGALRTLETLRLRSADLEQALETCRQRSLTAQVQLDCIADALGAYAAALESLTLDLPPALANVGAIIREAQRGVQQARERAAQRLATATTDAERREIERAAVAEATGSVQTAIAEIRKSIELIRADDPQLASVFAEQGATVVAAVQKVEFELARAVGL